jgi:hypothetical protein
VLLIEVGVRALHMAVEGQALVDNARILSVILVDATVHLINLEKFVIGETCSDNNLGFRQVHF